ncbi:hypothetical protein C8R48DRAFT_669170 [Suillus tomentosus]|nr:hypothetical protein C8R48DRAFT_669170 [Suillus tomentosus]
MGIKRVQCDDDDDNDDNELVSFEEIAAARRKAKDLGNAARSTAVMKLPAAEDLSYHSPHHSMQPLEHSSDADNDSVLLEQSLADFPMSEEFLAHLDTDIVDFMNDSVEEQRADADHDNEMSCSLPPQKPGRRLNQLLDQNLATLLRHASLEDPLTGTESSDKQPEVPPSSVQVPDVQPASPVPVNELLEPPLPPDVILDGASQHWFWKIILILVAWLNLRYHLPHRAANLLLKVTASIFYGLGVFALKEKPAQTLNTAFAHLALADYFEVHPMCPTCMRVFPHNSPSDAVCTHCSTPLFHETRPQDIPTKSSSVTKPSRSTMKPKLRCPQNPLSNGILRLLSQDGIELQLDAWRSQPTTPGKRSSIQDDGNLFFDNTTEHQDADELRIGITLGFDGFSYQRSSNAGSHSSGVMSSCVANLPTHLRYQPRPKELDSDQLQFFMKDYVDDLLRLYDKGIIIKTSKYPEGRRVHVILVAVCCDHPAMCKSKLKTEDAMEYDKFPHRDGQQHRKHAEEYNGLGPKEQDDFFTKHSARWFELARLPYFDPVQMTVIDPMHCFLLGIIKTQWFNAWVQTNVLHQKTAKVERELDEIHRLLSTFEMPSWVARLPDQVGYPAGGSLTSDEWKGLALIFCPIAIPLVWEKWYPINMKQNQKEIESWEKREQACVRRIASGKQAQNGKDNEPPTHPKDMAMHADDADNFLNLAAALKIILGRSISDADIPRAKKLLNKYLLRFLEIHPKHVKPSHHWGTHIFEQLEDYGPVYGFWTFLFERLNKMTNLLARNAGSDEPPSAEDSFLFDAVKAILTTDSDTRGTVASLASEIDDVAQQAGTRFSLSPASSSSLDLEQQKHLLRYYQMTHSHANIVSVMSYSLSTPNFLQSHAQFHDYVILDGRRITSSHSRTHAPNSIVQVNTNQKCYIGQVHTIISHWQIGVELDLCLLEVRWFEEAQDLECRHWIR